MMQNAEVPPFVDAMEMPQNELREVVQIDPPVPINGAPVVPPQLATRMGSSIGTIRPFDVCHPENWARYLTHNALQPETQRDIFYPWPEMKLST